MAHKPITTTEDPTIPLDGSHSTAPVRKPADQSKNAAVFNSARDQATPALTGLPLKPEERCNAVDAFYLTARF